MGAIFLHVNTASIHSKILLNLECYKAAFVDVFLRITAYSKQESSIYCISKEAMPKLLLTIGFLQLTNPKLPVIK